MLIGAKSMSARHLFFCVVVCAADDTVNVATVNVAIDTSGAQAQAEGGTLATGEADLAKLVASMADGAGTAPDLVNIMRSIDSCAS